MKFEKVILNNYEEYYKSAISGAHLVHIGIPTIGWYTMPSNCTYIFSTRNEKSSHTSVQVQHVNELYFFLEKNEIQTESWICHLLSKWDYDALLTHKFSTLKWF